MKTLLIVLGLCLCGYSIKAIINNENCMIEIPDEVRQEGKSVSKITNENFGSVTQGCAIMSSNTCYQCIEGYVLSENNQCILTPLDPRLLNKYTSISTSKMESDSSSSLNPYNEFLYRNAAELKEPNPNCLTYSGCGQCIQCPVGTTNERYSCKPIQATSACIKMTGPICSVCLKGAVRDRNTCRFPDQNCLSWNFKGGCSSCKQGYAVEGLVCVRQGRLAFNYKEHNCQEWKDGECIACFQSFSLQNGACKPAATQGFLRRTAEPKP